MDKSEEEIKQEISKVLMIIGIPANLLGFNYFKMAILKVVKNDEYLIKVTKFLYPEVGKMFNVSGAMVERSMRHALDNAYQRNRFLLLNDLFHAKIIEPYYKPSSSELIALINEYIRWENII